LQQQVLLYQEWRNRLQTPVLDIDTSVIAIEDLQEIANWIGNYKSVFSILEWILLGAK
jgi:hypothetical protein